MDPRLIERQQVRYAHSLTVPCNQGRIILNLQVNRDRGKIELNEGLNLNLKILQTIASTVENS